MVDFMGNLVVIPFLYSGNHIAMTKGYKGDLFVMYLSFFGWALLATLSLYIGYLWLIPYMESTQLYAYRYLKETALKTGVLKPEDFGVVPTYTQG